MPTSMTTAPGLTMSARERVAPADRGDHDVGLARVQAQVGRGAVAHRDGGIGLQQQQRHRLADGVAAADDHRVLALDGDAGAFDQLHAAVGRGRAQPRQAGHQLARRVHAEAVDVLGGSMAAITACASMCLGSGICTRMPWMRGSAFSAAMRASSSALRQRGRVGLEHAVQAVLGAGLDLVAHVDRAGRVVADQDHRQARAGGRAAVSARHARRRRRAGSATARCRRSVVRS